MDYDEIIKQATDELRQTQVRLGEAREKIMESQTKASSPDGTIVVVLNGQGDLSSITFKTAKWRRMSPAELGALLVQTINRAREQGREDLMKTYGSFMPKGFGMLSSHDGEWSLDKMFDDAMRTANEILADGSSDPDIPRSAD
jgi:DNA-binding protein YbaB